MKMNNPMITSDLSFARDICGSAAEYFNPYDPGDIANSIIGVANNRNRQKELIQNGRERLKNFETSKSRADKYIDICEEIT